MNTDEIFFRYWNAVEETAVADGLLPSVAVRLCLRLAVEDARAAGDDQIEFLNSVIASQVERMQAIQDAQDASAALCNDMAAIIAAQKTIGPELRQAEADRAQMALIAEWLAENAPALYYGEQGGYGDAIIEAVRRRDDQIAELQGEIAKLDADNADLTTKLKAAQQSWATAQADADRLALRIAQQPAEIHANGNGAAPTEVDDWRFHLTDAEQEFLESVETGRRRFGGLERSTRLAIVQAFARHIGNGLLPTQAVFDAAKPAWMPGAGGIAAGFGVPWSQILDLDPAAVQR